MLGDRKRAPAQQIPLITGIRLPSAPCRFESALPRQEHALGSNPIAQLAPSPEDRLMRHLGVGFPALGCCRDEKAVGMIG
jgi:hypothetical protein